MLEEAKNKITDRDVADLYNVTISMMSPDIVQNLLRENKIINDFTKIKIVNDYTKYDNYHIIFMYIDEKNELYRSPIVITLMEFIALTYDNLTLEIAQELLFQVGRSSHPDNYNTYVETFCECLRRNKNLPNDLKLWAELQ